MKAILAVLVFAGLWLPGLSQQRLIRGHIVEQDSLTVLPFVYVINKSNGNGVVSDLEGKFSIAALNSDTIMFSYVGYLKYYLPVSSVSPSQEAKFRVVMHPLPVRLQDVSVTAFKIRPYEREYMKNIIEESRVPTLNYVSSPITALYMQYSKEGRQIRKLAKIFENLLLEEEVQKKLSRERLVQLTGDDTIDYDAFRRYCYYVNDYFIASHDGYELYARVMECYRQYKNDTQRARSR